MLKISVFHTSNYYKLKSVIARDVLLFANDSRNASQSLFFFTVHRLKLIAITNLYQFNRATSNNGLTLMEIENCS
jgi:hypothetical protein